MTNGTPETLHWYQTITKNLTGCTISNSASQVEYGESYTATISADDGKELTSVVIKMGGVDTTATAYTASRGAINIANVTGNITITCAAVVTNIIDTIGISADTRLSTSSGDNRTQSGYAAIGQNKNAASLIHLQSGDTLRIKGASLPDSNDSYSALAIHSASGNFTVATYLHNGTSWNNLTFTNNGDTVVVAASAEQYFRVSLICTDASSVIATINEPIE